MARSRTRSTRATSSRATTRRPAATTPEEPEESGLGFEAGLAIITTIALLVAVLFVDYELGTYGKGLFFG